MNSQAPIVIVGGGLAGSLTALALHERRPDLPIVLLEAGECFGGNHTWSFFDSDVPQGSTALVSALSPVCWPRHRVKFQNRERELPLRYNAVSSVALDALVRHRLPPGCWRLGAPVSRIEPEGVTLQSGEWIAARAVLDARGPQSSVEGLKLGWQKFVGLEFAATHGEGDCATVMDATLDQIDGFRFLYVLPLAADRVLLEDTYYSDTPALNVGQIADRLRDLAKARGVSGHEVRQETGVLPVVIGGDPDRFWPRDDRVARLGLRGGFFHQTTGYSFGNALRIADALSSIEGDLNARCLAEWTRARFLEHWRSSSYYRLLNKMLFHAARPAERHRVFAHFYRLPPDLIARFYAGSLTMRDRVMILSGKPPVSMTRAIAAIAGFHGKAEP